MFNYEIFNDKKRLSAAIFALISALVGFGMIYYAAMLLFQGTGVSLYHIVMVFTGTYLILSFFKTIVRDNDANIFSIVSFSILSASEILLGVMKISQNDSWVSILSVFIFAGLSIFIAIYGKHVKEKRYVFLYSMTIGTFFKVISIVTSKYSFVGALMQKGEIYTDNSTMFSLLATIIAVFFAISQTLYFSSVSRKK